MSNLFTEATRVQLTAIQHLARIGYTYLGKISECCAISGSGTLKDASSAALANIAFDSETNILVDIFAEQFKKLNPTANVSAQSILSDIQKELDDDDLGQ
jgi:type I restriction enzyme R subunit